MAGTTWESIFKCAKEAGAKYPELVAAQWALESGWGEHLSGKNNFFGLKGSGTTCETTEVFDGETVTVYDGFLDFETPEACVQYLVDRWYKDFKHWKGVNRAKSHALAAEQLQLQGYATDPGYAEKLIQIIVDQTPTPRAPKRKRKILYTISAIQPTWLKKFRVQAIDLSEDQRVDCGRGQKYDVLEVKEVADDSHVEVVLGHGCGTWFVYEPHWKRVLREASESVVGELDWTNFDRRVTPNLTVGEVLQWDKRRIPPVQCADRFRILKAAAEFQKLREAWGSPIAVTSFYRPEPVNTEVGGVPHSRHCSGEAFDVYPVERSVDEFYKWIVQRWTGGLGDARARGYVHLDIRDGGCFIPGAGARPCVEWSY